MILAKEAKKLYKDSFGKGDLRIFYSHGRLELLGNHTDHQGGLCLVAGVDLGITAAVEANKDGAVRVVSEGYPAFQFYTDELDLQKGEAGTTKAIFKGVMAKMKERGYKVGGFSAALKSDLPAGSGLSSSAAVEALACHIVDVLYNHGKMAPDEMAVISQFAERVYFGKPCGMLDQVGCCFGGVDYIDFNHAGAMYVKPISYGLTLEPILINTGSSHENLTDYYASIPADMFAVAKNLLGVDKLSDCTKEEFFKKVTVPCDGVSERAKLRATHYYQEIDRVAVAFKALETNDSSTFLNCVRGSQTSSQTLLGNTMVPGQYEHSPQQAVDIANKVIGKGGARIMGGGFAGSIICFVYPTEKDAFIAEMAKYYGAEGVIPLKIVDGGPREIA